MLMVGNRNETDVCVGEIGRVLLWIQAVVSKIVLFLVDLLVPCRFYYTPRRFTLEAVGSNTKVQYGSLLHGDSRPRRQELLSAS